MQINPTIHHRKKNIPQYIFLIIVALLGVGIRWIYATYEPAQVETPTSYTLGEYVDLAEKLKTDTQPKVQDLIEDILEIKMVEKYLANSGVDYKAWEYLFYTTWGTTYKIGVDIAK